MTTRALVTYALFNAAIVAMAVIADTGAGAIMGVG